MVDQEGDATPFPPYPEAGAAGCVAADVLFWGEEVCREMTRLSSYLLKALNKRA